jgi:hypothetical protein
MTPSLEIGNGNWAVQSDSLLGYKTINGKYYPREMSVTRATTATRVNADGLVELVPYNLLTYSETFSDASWSKNSVTIGGSPVSSPINTLNASVIIENVGPSGFSLSRSISSLSSGVYTLSAYVKSNGRNWFALGLLSTSNSISWFNISNGTIGTVQSASSATITNVGNGWYRCTITVTVASGANTPALFLCNSDNSFNYTGNGTSGIYLWGAQLVEGTQALNYLPTTDRIDIARVDYSTGEAALLVEPQRTNSCLWSEDFSNASWLKSEVTITTNVATSPSGLINADKFIPTTANATHQMRITGLSSAAYTASIYAKADGETTFSIWLRSASVRAIFDLSNGTITSTSASVVATITNVGNGWYRCTAYDPTPGTTFQIYGRDGGPFIGNNINGIFIWGAQLEIGAFPTSYIPTTSTSVTRNSDVISRSNIFTNGYITSAGGTWFIDLRNNLSLIRDVFSWGINLSTLSTGGENGFSIRLNGNSISQRLSINKLISNTETFLLTTTANTSKIAIKWNGTTADVFVNGVKVVTATAFTITNMQFLNLFAGDVPKYINSMALYPIPLSDAELINLTTI